MFRIIAVFFAFLLAASGQETPVSPSGLQVSIGLEEISPGIDGVPRELTVIAVTISNPGDSPQWLVVGSVYDGADHWNVTANSIKPDGRIVQLSHLPRMLVVTGPLLDVRDFEEVEGNGSTNLSGFIRAPAQQLQIVVHCGVSLVPENAPAIDS